MCGRYYIEIDDEEIRGAINRIAEETVKRPGDKTVKTSGEIFPTDTVPVQTGVLQYTPMKWGFTGFNNKPVINARSETAVEKPMFRASMLERRCLIPASGYYEWQKDGRRKTKYRCYIPNETIYLAGCYRPEKNSSLSSFVILTREAVNGLEAIHDRMPVIIPKEHMSTWLNKTSSAMDHAVEELIFEALM